jgi:hypothetical protein
MSSTEMTGWKTLAAKRHSPSVLAGAAAVLAVPYFYAQPQAVHYAAAAVLVSGVVSAAIECARWALQKIT